MTTVAELVIGADAGRWRAVGFDVSAVGVAQFGGVRVRFVDGATGLVQWVLAGAPDESVIDIDGLPTAHGDPETQPGPAHANSATTIDHVVIRTPDLERTTEAIALATGAELRRIREAGAMRQGFHRLGEVIVEVVSIHDVRPAGDSDPATFWGLALNATDLDALFERAGGELMSPPKQAVQSGRRIASFRPAAELGLPVAVMTTSRRP